MKKSQRIQLIVDIKAKHEQNSLTALVEFQQKRQLAEQQLEHLKHYRQEYIDKFSTRSGAGIGIQTLLEFRSFIDKLDIAIAGQVKTVQQCLAEETRKRQVWEGLHQQTESLQKVCAKFSSAEAHLENKREQLESDDRASRMSRRQN